MSAARTYAIIGQNMTVGANSPTTLAFVNPKSSQGIRITRVEVSQEHNNTAVMVGVQLHTSVTAFPTLTGFTPLPLNTDDAISQIVSGTAGAAGTCGINASVEGAGAKTVRYATSFNNQNGWIWVPTPTDEIRLPAGSASGFGVALRITPTDTAGWNVYLEFSEL
jgi:hypothetical protein